MKNLIDVIMIKFNSILSNLVTNKIKVSMVCVITLALNGVSTQARADNMLTYEDATLLGAVDHLYPELEFNSILTPDLQITNYLDYVNRIPVITGNVTSGFGTRKHPVSGKRKKHTGIDISAPRHSPVYAPANGTVIFSGWKGGYGFTVEIDHGNGYTTLFAHHSKNMVSAGEDVTRDVIIGTVGTTGVSTGPHKHIEIRLNGDLVNPQAFYELDSVPDSALNF